MFRSKFQSENNRANGFVGDDDTPPTRATTSQLREKIAKGIWPGSADVAVFGLENLFGCPFSRPDGGFASAPFVRATTVHHQKTDKRTD